MSSVGWIDFSSEHRNKVRTVIDLLRKPGVVDELGIGVIRDTFADLMFPGISTIQTRAKYFTLTALLIREYERKTDAQKRKESLEDYFAKREKECRIQLAKRYKDKGGGLGIIGISFGEDNKKDVQRPPSTVYWNGLRTFGILPTKLSLPEFSRLASGKLKSLKSVLMDAGNQKGDDHDAEDRLNPRVRVPEVDKRYSDKLSITLTRSEAEFLRHQITSNVPKSLLAQILLDEEASSQVAKLSDEAGFIEFARLPFLRSLTDQRMKRIVSHADDFWTLLEGAHIRYNCLLAKAFGSQDRTSELEEEWEAWREDIPSFDWDRWSTSFLWSLVDQHTATLKGFTRQFVDDWIEQSQLGATDLARCDRLVIDQERRNKKSRARLRPNNKDDHYKEWIGLNGLDYRLREVKTLVQDICRGESGEADANVGR